MRISQCAPTPDRTDPSSPVTSTSVDWMSMGPGLGHPTEGERLRRESQEKRGWREGDSPDDRRRQYEHDRDRANRLIEEGRRIFNATPVDDHEGMREKLEEAIRNSPPGRMEPLETSGDFVPSEYRDGTWIREEAKVQLKKLGWTEGQLFGIDIMIPADKVELLKMFLGNRVGHFVMPPVQSIAEEPSLGGVMAEAADAVYHLKVVCEYCRQPIHKRLGQPYSLELGKVWVHDGTDRRQCLGAPTLARPRVQGKQPGVYPGELSYPGRDSNTHPRAEFTEMYSGQELVDLDKKKRYLELIFPDGVDKRDFRAMLTYLKSFERVLAANGVANDKPKR